MAEEEINRAGFNQKEAEFFAQVYYDCIQCCLVGPDCAAYFQSDRLPYGFHGIPGDHDHTGRGQYSEEQRTQARAGRVFSPQVALKIQENMQRIRRN